MKTVICLLLTCACASACARDAVSPQRAVVTPAIALHDGAIASALADEANVITFEDFTLGAIHGQHDWLSLGGVGAPAPGSACGVYDHEIADYATVVPDPNRVSSFGQRSLRISNAVTSGCYADQTFSSAPRTLPGRRERGRRAVTG